MEKGKVYFWFCIYNTDYKSYLVADSNCGINTLVDVENSVNPSFTDIWKVSDRYYEKNKDMFLELTSTEQYNDLCEKLSKIIEESLVD